ncbi:hypothetical protein NAT51_15490 [Flavobacterium amniphilum]|uniref:hypothetical protein n=1 Tax=Flavobacterium amniphilum TaxID=1834035 RepID=UPI00202A0647|nr:hypothetical protein [Flavobacterium amniphilum]MCL9806939.1 hypothetical protein [Flavobacterium amniphilum]
MQTNNQILISDALSHLNAMKNDFARLRLDYNDDKALVYATGKYIESCELIGQLIKSYDNYNFKLLSNNINNVLLKDAELHGILITIRKSKYIDNLDHSKMASIIFEI